ncbi:uncharacterized protein E5676_scaffold419G00700 [Cucumis melo var. makuwa]|uniref:Uncharacterized protein n=1 Tax=Cucumis melo var. makuwa TaxID=1194695 RepID=A0A5A7U625_CUCMM|nr:uncharacterized protein E6C27_scaffold55G00400 [Cucumis melo var. makuwa]TYK23890.1 uncharacterized protein E5676_scaffold419G00700 [Cucumis melo var. makuwa]
MNSEALQVAKAYRQLLKAVKKHIGKEESKKHFVDYDLLFSYNIAVDRSDEMKRILGKSAASVGLSLPESYKVFSLGDALGIAQHHDAVTVEEKNSQSGYFLKFQGVDDNTRETLSLELSKSVELGGG